MTPHLYRPISVDQELETYKDCFEILIKYCIIFYIISKYISLPNDISSVIVMTSIFSVCDISLHLE
jgi:hypothetical protein